MASFAQRTTLQYSDSALLSDTTFWTDDQVVKVCCLIRRVPPEVERRVFRKSSCVGVGESIDCHDALLVLQFVMGTPTRRVEQVSSGTLQTCEVRSARVPFPSVRLHSLQANAMSSRSDARYASLADTLWWGFLPGRLQLLEVMWCVPRGAAWARLKTCLLESKLCATASCACRRSASHVNPESLHVTQRFNTVA